MRISVLLLIAIIMTVAGATFQDTTLFMLAGAIVTVDALVSWIWNDL